jgi:hypothetical protein
MHRDAEAALDKRPPASRAEGDGKMSPGEPVPACLSGAGRVTDDAIAIRRNVADLYAEAGIIPAPLDMAKIGASCRRRAPLSGMKAKWAAAREEARSEGTHLPKSPMMRYGFAGQRCAPWRTRNITSVSFSMR